MKNIAFAMVAVLALAACTTTKVTCGPGTIAIANGVNPDAPGYIVNYKDHKYVDQSGKAYDDVVCRSAAPTTACGPNMDAVPATTQTVHADGGGYFVKHDGSGFFVKHDDAVPAQKVCVQSEPGGT